MRAENTSVSNSTLILLFAFLAENPESILREIVQCNSYQEIVQIFCQHLSVTSPAATEAVNKYVVADLTEGSTKIFMLLNSYSRETEFSSLTPKLELFITADVAFVLSQKGQDILKNYKDRFLAIDSETDFKKLVFIINRLLNSSSATVRKLEGQLVDVLLSHPEPEKILAIIETVFQFNPKFLPVTAELLLFTKLVFQTDTSADLLRYSPLMGDLNHRIKHFWIAQMMLRNHLFSDSRWMKMYFNTINENLPLLERKLKGESLEPTDDEKLSNLLKGWVVISRLIGMMRQRTINLDFLNQLSDSQSFNPDTLLDNLLTDFNISREVAAADSVVVVNTVAKSLFGFMGINNWSELQQIGETKRKESSNRNSRVTQLSYFEGKQVLVKAFHSAYFEDGIGELGFQAKEFYKQDSDLTPGDVDALRQPGEKVAEAAKNLSGYGDVTAVIEDRGQFHQSTKVDEKDNKTRRQELKKVATENYELFGTKVVSPDHVGVAVGIPITEVTTLIVADNYPPEKLLALTHTLARKDLYIPIFSVSGTLLLTQERFNEVRQIFDGISEFSSQESMYETQAGNNYYQAIQEVQAEKFSAVEGKASDSEKISDINSTLFTKLTEAVTRRGMTINHQNSLTVNGVTILNTGSTGRLSNVPGESDFDLAILLDQADWAENAESLFQEVRGLWPADTDGSHGDAKNNYYLAKLTGVDLGDGQLVDLDISIKLKSSHFYPASHEAVESKFNSIRSQYGETAYQEVISTIVYTKKLLKKYNAYKEGLKGIGTENWLLAHRGNLLNACQSFSQTAFNGNPEGSPISLAEFKTKYVLLNAGTNIKDMDHDNYFAKMSESAYVGMCQMVRDVLSNRIPDLSSSPK